MAQKLKIYLVNQAGDLSGRFEEAHRKKCGEILKGYFEGAIKTVSRYDGVEVSWTGKQADPTAFDFVCYLETTQKGSIVAKKSSATGGLGLSGTTAPDNSADKAVISEVYLRQIVQNGEERGNATADREALVANCIFHELAHNLLDAKAVVITDVHKLQKGVILRDTDKKALSGSESPNEVDYAAVRNGFNRRTNGVKQYTAEMPS